MKLRRKASVTLPCEPALAYEILSDYAGYSQWMPWLKSSRLLAHETNFAIAEFEFSARPGRMLTVECLHAPRQTVITRSLSGSRPALKVEWAIAPTPSGQSEVTVKIEGSLFLPLLMGGYRTLLDPKKCLEGLQSLVAMYGDGPAGDKLIEITETEEGLICSYQGTRYRLKAIS